LISYVPNVAKKKRSPTIWKQSIVQENPTMVAEEEGISRGLEMVVHEQSPMVVKEEHRANIYTPNKTIKRAVPKKKLICNMFV
jgi:hypothetical protein